MRVIYSLGLILVLIIPIFFQLLAHFFDYKIKLIDIILGYSVAAALAMGVVYVIKRRSRKMKHIGRISFSTSAIYQQSGDLRRSITIADVVAISLEAHYPETGLRVLGKGIHKTYIMGIMLRNNKSENYIVASDSANSKYSLDKVLTTLCTKTKLKFTKKGI